MIFINPSCFHSYRSPSLGMLYITAYMRRNGLPVDYLDCNYHPDWKNRLQAMFREHKMAGITANVLSILPALDVAQHLRENYPSVRIVMGGPYPSVEYEKLIPDFADVVVIGEGEETTLELARGTSLENILGIAYSNNKIQDTRYRIQVKDYELQNSKLNIPDHSSNPLNPVNSKSTIHNSQFKINSPRPLLTNLDVLPFPAWDMGDVKKYRLSHTRRSPFLPIMTSRGCPFRCIFCGSKIIHRSRLRTRSIENVIAEIDELYDRYGAREIHVWDDNFTLIPERTMEICDRIIERGYRGLYFSIPAGIKPDVGNDKLFRKMARAGFYMVCIAVETGDQTIMNKLGKKVDLSKIKDVIRAARRAGIYTNGFFMLGLPFDTDETMEKTISFACSLPLNQALFFVTIPFPGTEVYDIVKREGKFLFHVDGGYWNKGYFLGKASCEMPGFTAAALERMYRRAYRRFYLRPAQILRVLRGGRVHSLRDVFHTTIRALKVITRGRQF